MLLNYSSYDYLLSSSSLYGFSLSVRYIDVKETLKNSLSSGGTTSAVEPKSKNWLIIHSRTFVTREHAAPEQVWCSRQERQCVFSFSLNGVKRAEPR